MGTALPRLLVISGSPACLQGDRVLLDVKFVEGMRFNAAAWGGAVECLMAQTSVAPPFYAEYDLASLPFGVKLLASGGVPDPDQLAGYDVVLAPGDGAGTLELARICAGLPLRLFYVIEYILETRLQIIALDRQISWLRKARRMLWALTEETRRRRAFRLAAGLQANGYPAAEAYRRVNPNTLLYLDNRVDTALAATGAEMAARRARLLAGGRLRLLHSGRLEPMKGAQDLIPVALAAKRAGVEFELNIFGTGSLEPDIRAAIRKEGLEGQVFLHGAVDFETVLVPFARTEADVFLSCHRQSDPSCTYLESMGCGLPILGYANRMWGALAARSEGGWGVPLGDVAALGRQVVALAGQPEEVIAKGEAAWAFARTHLFEAEFSQRIAHLAKDL